MSEKVGDRELVRRAQRGDEAALVALYRRYAPEVYRFLLHQTGSVPDAEDLTSETFLRLVRSIDSFKMRSSFRTWLYEIARNQLRDHWRKTGRRPRTISLEATVLAAPAKTAPAAPPGAPSAAEPDARADRASTTALGRAVLEALPDNYRRVLSLRVLEGRSVRDTAEEMGTSEGNVKVMTHRALKAAAKIAASAEQMT